MLEQHEISEIYCLWVVGGRMIAFPFLCVCVCPSLFPKCFTTDMTCIYCNHKVLLTSPWGHEGQTASVQEGHEDSDPGALSALTPLSP